MSDVYDPFLAGVVRILDVSGTIIGTGFALSLSSSFLLIATCTHVVEEANPRLLENRATESVSVIFEADPQHGQRAASVETTTSSEVQDVTILRVEGEIPRRVRSLRLGLTTGIEGRSVSTFGYPETGSIIGSWGYSNYCKLGPKKKGEGQSLLYLQSPTITGGFSGAPVWDDARHVVVGMITDVALTDRLGRGTQTAYAIPVDDIRECYTNVLVDVPSPFHGLAPFTEGEAQQFFGYTETTEKLVHTLHTSEKFLAVLGPAGCGKTSVVQAGLIPRLRKDETKMFHSCGIIVAHLTHNPFEQLQLQGLYGASQNFAESIHTWCQQQRCTRLVLVLDQFEELLQYCPERLQIYFIEQLVDVIQRNVATVIVILGDTFYSLLMNHTKLTSLVESSLVHVIAPQSKDLLLESVQKRAALYGVTFTPQLLEHITQEVVKMQSQNGKKQHTLIAQYELLLTHIWSQRRPEQTVIDVSDISFENIQVDLNEWAEQIFLKLSIEQQEFLKKVLVQLVYVGNASQGTPKTTRSAPLLPLCQNVEEQELLYSLAKTGLLTTYRDLQTHLELVTIAQNILLHTWTRLEEWTKEEQQFGEWQHTLEQKVSTRTSRSLSQQIQDEPVLLNALELQEASLWIEKRKQNIPQHIQSLVTVYVSIQEQERKRSTMIRENEEQRRLAVARQLAVQARKLQEQGTRNLQLSVLLSVEAMRQTICTEAYRVLYEGMALLPRLEGTLFHNNNGVHFITFSSNGCYLATASLNGVVWVRDLSAGGTLCYMFYAGSELRTLAFSLDGKYLVTTHENEEAKIWETQSGCVHVILPHKGRVRSAAFSPTLPYFVATASDDCTVGLWDITSDGGSLSQWLPHQRVVERVIFSLDGRFLLTLHGVDTINVYHASSGKLLNYMQHTRSVHTVAFSPDGLTIALIDATPSVLLWQWKNEQKEGKKKSTRLVRSLLHEKLVHTIAFSPDSTLLASVSENKVIIWNIVHASEQNRMHHEERITSVAFNNTGNLLVTGSIDGTASIWEVSNATEYLHIVHEKAIHTIMFSPNGRYLVTGSEDGSAKIWATTRGGHVVRIHHHDGAKAVAFTSSHDGSSLLATAGDDAFVQLSYFMKDSFHFGARFFHGKSVRTLAWSPDGTYIASGGDDGIAYVWSAVNEYKHLTIAHNGSVHAVAWSSDGRCIVSASEDGTAQVWNIATKQMQLKISHQSPIYTTAFHPIHHYVATGSLDGRVSVWTYDQPGKSFILANVLYGNSINKVVFSPSGHLLASASDDGNVRLWRWEADNQQFLLLTHDEPVYSLTFSRDGLYLASGDSSGTVKIWETGNGQMLAYLSHTQEVWAISFSSDGSYLATASGDHTARVWEKASGQQLAHFPHTKSVYGIEFSLDGKYIVTASGDGTANVWLWQPEDIIDEACQRLTRNFTREEWLRYMGSEPYHKTCHEFLWRGIQGLSNE